MRSESLPYREKRGAASYTGKQRLQRWIKLLQEREPWRETFAEVYQMHAWLLQAEAIFDGSWAHTSEEVTQIAVETRLHGWLARLEAYVGTLPQETRLAVGLGELARVLRHLQPHLVCCYDVEGLPRTNNDLERCIRAIKTRYRRISGRKNWNAYLLRYGSGVAYYEWWSKEPEGRLRLDARLLSSTRGSWRTIRTRARAQHQPQLDRFRFPHRRQQFLAALEAQWSDACST